jgi:hypothetical protein
MITKEQYIEALANEFRIIKHLAEKVTPEQLTHKPTEPQRTLEELMHYLTYIFIAGTDSAINGNADAWKKYTDTPVPTLANFNELLDKETSEVKALIEPMTDEDLKQEVAMWGRTQSKAMHLLGLLKMASAYKMQLFLYMKASGTKDIGTMNLWAGMDQPPKVQ